MTPRRTEGGEAPRTAGRDGREFRLSVSEEQRRQRGCIAGRMQRGS